MRDAPVSSVSDLLVAILERGVCLVIRLQGPPDARELALGVGLADSAAPIIAALCASDGLGRPQSNHAPGGFDDIDWS